MNQLNKQILLTISLFSLVACNSNLSVDETSQKPNSTTTTKTAPISFAAIGTENENCKVIGVESETTFVDEDHIGMNVYMSDDVLVTEIEDSVFESEINTENYGVSLEGASEFLLDYEFWAVVASPREAPDVIDLIITGFENPESEAHYVITIAENSITCDDGSQNSSAYEIDLTLIHSDVVSNCVGEQCAANLEEYENRE